MKATPSEDGFGDEYEVVPLRFSWGGLSLVTFLLALSAHYILRLQPWRPPQLWMWPFVRVTALGALSLLGLAAGLLGLRFSTSRGVARIGVLLNAAVLGCVLLVALGMLVIFYLR